VGGGLFLGALGGRDNKKGTRLRPCGCGCVVLFANYVQQAGEYGDGCGCG
jgi:hypothetical protein